MAEADLQALLGGAEAGADLQAEADTSGIKTFTIDDFPELSGMQVGDELVLRIANVDPNGQTYDLEVVNEGASPDVEAGTPDLSQAFTG